MKRLLQVVIGMVMVMVVTMAMASAKSSTLKDGVIEYSAGSYLEGEPIPLGVDPFGYNYQAHMFSGSYFNSYANSAGLPPYTGDDDAYLADNPDAADHWAWPYRDAQLSMKWNDAWISNKDRDNDGKLDRHYGFPSYIGSGAWLTNHQSGEDDGYKWSDFVKIVAVPADAEKVDGVWFRSDGKEIAPDIWGQFALIQEVYNDSNPDIEKIRYRSPVGPGFGKY